MTIQKAAAMKLRWRVAMQAIIRRAKDTAINPSSYQSLCVRISQLGYRKNEPNPIDPETPKVLRHIIEIYLTERGYTVPQLSEAMLCTEAEFRKLYLDGGDLPGCASLTKNSRCFQYTLASAHCARVSSGEA